MEELNKILETVDKIKQNMQEEDYRTIMDSLKKLHDQQPKKFQVYYTHDNGGRPYRLHVEDKKVEVFISHYVKEHVELSGDVRVVYGSEPYYFFKEFTAKKVFVGKSPFTYTTEYSGGYGSRFDGNSVLLEVNDNEYIFIGDCIYSFTSLAKIVEYVSEVGNSDVPYPYAIDKKGNTYLMIEDVILLNKMCYDPYKTYYDSYCRGNKKVIKDKPKTTQFSNRVVILKRDF